MSDIVELKRTLSSRAQSVAEYLLPAGKREGHEWRVGSIDGEPGRSLGVHLAGEKAGVWSDFSRDQSGDLIDLWQMTRKMDLPAALDDIRVEEGYSAIFANDPQTSVIVSADKNLDITDKVSSRLRATPAAKIKATDAAKTNPTAPAGVVKPKPPAQ